VTDFLSYFYIYARIGAKSGKKRQYASCVTEARAQARAGAPLVRAENAASAVYPAPSSVRGLRFLRTSSRLAGFGLRPVVDLSTLVQQRRLVSQNPAERLLVSRPIDQGAGYERGETVPEWGQ
jgi:hypothetical protein